MASRVPRYHQIARTLRERITASAHAPGERLADQRSLAREFGVTVMTLRQALDLLERDGLIARRHGLGTFVARPAIDYDILQLRTLAGDLSALGEDVATRFLRSHFAAADRRVAALLGLAERADVFVLERLRLVDGEPMSFQTSYLPAALGEEVSKADLAVTPLRQALTFKLGIEITAARETVAAVLLDRRAAHELGCRPGVPAFRSDRVSVGPDGIPVVYDLVFIPGDRFRITRHLDYRARGTGRRDAVDLAQGRSDERLREGAEPPHRSPRRSTVMRTAAGAKEPNRRTEVFDVHGEAVTAREAGRMSAAGAKEPNRRTEVFDVQPR